MSLSISEKRELLLKMVNNVGSSSRHSIRNAWQCIDRARAIQNDDPEMSCFRAITAEEEASTALIKIIKERGYENSNILSAKIHPHKCIAFMIFVIVSKHFRTNLYDQGITTAITGFNEESLKIKIFLHDGVAAEPTPPLHLFLNENEAPYFFEHEIQALIEEMGANKISSILLDQANIRNLLIYANEQGIPKAEANQNDFIGERETRVYSMTIIYLLIAQHKQKQNLVQQCVNVASDVAKKIKDKQ